jgi:hypothetical protein
MTIPPKKLSFIDDRSLLIYDSSSIQVHYKLAGKYYQATNWNLSDFNLKYNEAQINHVLANDTFAIIILVGKSKREGNQIICINRVEGLVKSFPLPSFDKILRGNMALVENSLLVKIITSTASLIKIPLDKSTLDLTGPIEETVVMNMIKGNELEQAKLFDISPKDSFILVSLMNSSLCVSQITTLCTQSHILEGISSILYLTRALNFIYLAVKEADDSVSIYKFNLESFELSGSFHLLDPIDSQSFVHFHLIPPAKLLLFGFKENMLAIQLVDLSSMDILEICTDKFNFLSSEIADVRISKGLNVQILLTNGSIIDYSGLACRNTWNNLGSLFGEKFEFNHWFNVLEEFIPLCDVPIGIPFLGEMTKNISTWTEMRSNVDRIINDKNLNTLNKLQIIGFLIGTRGNNYAKYCKSFSIHSFEKIQIDFAISLKKGENLGKYFPVIPLNWFSYIKTNLTRPQLNELANYLVNANFTTHLDIIVASDIEPVIILDFARRNHLFEEIVNSLPQSSILQYPFTKKEFAQVFQSLTDYQTKFLLLKTRYCFADMYQLFINNRILLANEEPTVNNLKKAIPDIASLPTLYFNKFSLYPSLPNFDLSSSPQLPTTNVGSPAREKFEPPRKVSFAPSPYASIKSPPLHEPRLNDTKAIAGRAGKSATPRHHAAIQPSRLSTQFKLEKEWEETKEKPESPEEEKSPSKRGRRTVADSKAEKKSPPSPSKVPKTPPTSPGKKKKVVKEDLSKESDEERRSTSLSPYKKTNTPLRNKSLSPSKGKKRQEPFLKYPDLEAPANLAITEEERVENLPSSPRGRKRRPISEPAVELAPTDYFIATDVHNSPRAAHRSEYYSPARASPGTPSRKRQRGTLAGRPREKFDDFEDPDAVAGSSQPPQLEQKSSPPMNVSVRRKRKPITAESTPQKSIPEDLNVRHSPRLRSKQRTPYGK